MKISFVTLGCKLNQAETDELKNMLKPAGGMPVLFSSGEDICIIRACAVTYGASQTTREFVRRAKKNGAYVILCGCSENKDLKEIDFVGKNNDEVIKHILNMPNKRTEIIRCRPSQNDKQIDRTRKFIKIQTGCNFNCAYCIIPRFRGLTQSVPADEVIKKISLAVKNNYNEIILTGVNICLYQDKNLDLVQLLKKILKKTKIKRLRLGSLDPRLITPDLIKLYTNKKLAKRLMPHWHLSLQSGSDKILKLMNRDYTNAQYLAIVKKIQAKNPLFSFTTDIIVGFPSETKQDFAKSGEIIKKVGFSKAHIFPYSVRPGTTAEKISNRVQDKIIFERAKKLRALAARVGRNFAQKFIGQTAPVLFEHKKTAFWRGYTPQYLPIKIKSYQNLTNKIIHIKLNQKNLEIRN